ncbi:hypothetical protein COEREDRAFT_79028 [Coemansia reversa NRRL 1564]|uniref:Carbohydrate-binding module family 19 domain-containing protein n=1 Tax=Coemansia reversa (strain ATCC 12441 / NRRL 1564) TaxID=763665 RepID=A0A2G5BL86_COERN|nr:hypothetical protein COEREDRAFT_79028 [Coemansia reversa NRRL 1564]|eukprot:PIA19751.1 hypothetical protein COEREDRAFT_79028 [Coemansia reversa NRRL 1564]
MTTPISFDGILCKSNAPWPEPVANWTAGQDIKVQFQPGGAPHGGGHCQFSLSYDGGKSFVVIHEELRYCFVGGPSKDSGITNTSYTFNIPKNIPNSNSAIFAWSWVNAIGNREFYMNCADVTITGGSSTSYTGKQMVIANHNGYPNIPEFQGNYDTGIDLYQNAKNITVSVMEPSTENTDNGYSVISAPGESTDYTTLATSVGGDLSSNTIETPVKCVNPEPQPGSSSSATEDANKCKLDSETKTSDSSSTPDDEEYCGIETISSTPSAYSSISTDISFSISSSSSAYSDIPDTAAIPANYSATTMEIPDKNANVQTGAINTDQPYSGVPDSVGSTCSSNQTIRCSLSGNGALEQCVHGRWIETSCGPGTQCMDNNGSVYCGWGK